MARTSLTRSVSGRVAERTGKAIEQVHQAALFAALGVCPKRVERPRRRAAAAKTERLLNQRNAVRAQAGHAPDAVKTGSSSPRARRGSSPGPPVPAGRTTTWRTTPPASSSKYAALRGPPPGCAGHIAWASMASSASAAMSAISGTGTRFAPAEGASGSCDAGSLKLVHASPPVRSRDPTARQHRSGRPPPHPAKVNGCSNPWIPTTGRHAAMPGDATAADRLPPGRMCACRGAVGTSTKTGGCTTSVLRAGAA
jgi:hypothetical protein